MRNGRKKPRFSHRKKKRVEIPAAVEGNKSKQLIAFGFVILIGPPSLIPLKPLNHKLHAFNIPSLQWVQQARADSAHLQSCFHYCTEFAGDDANLISLFQ